MQLPPDANDDKYVNCDVCDKILLRHRYYEHKREHFKEKLHCSMCEKKFVQRGSLNRHEVQIHNSITGNLGNYAKKYKKKIISIPCKICNKILKKQNLEKHMLIHTQEKPYKCDSCERSFRQQGILYRHTLQIHRRDKLERLDCEVCGLTYFGKIALSYHMRYAHKNGMNPYLDKEVCPLCKAKLNTKVMKEAHNRYVHQNIDTCKLCNLKIRNYSHLKRHVEQVHSEANYECDKCSEKGERSSEVLKATTNKEFFQRNILVADLAEIW